MKIAVIGIEKNPTRVKNQRHCQELYTRIAARGHKVDIFTQAKHKQRSLISIRYYKNIRIVTLFTSLGKHLLSLLNAALNTILATFGSYDVIHIHETKNAWFVWFPQLFTVSKIVVTCNQIDSQKHRQHRFIFLLLCWIEKIVLKNADEIVVDSKTLKTYFQQNYHIDPNHIPNAPRSYILSDRHRFSYDKALRLNNQQYILYLGKLEPDCKPDLLIEAFRKLKPSGWKLVLIGETGDYPKYAARLLAMAQQDDIRLVDYTTEYSLAAIVRCAGLFVAPSNEGNLKSPLVMLEAMREGVPIIASNITVHQELIGKDRGLLFDSGKVESLSIQLEYALSQPISLMNMANKAKTYVMIHHNWDRVIYKNLFLYLKAGATIPTQSRKHRIFNR